MFMLYCHYGVVGIMALNCVLSVLRSQITSLISIETHFTIAPRPSQNNLHLLPRCVPQLSGCSGAALSITAVSLSKPISIGVNPQAPILTVFNGGKTS